MLKLPTLPKFCHKHKIISILGAILCVVLAVSLVQSQLMYTASYGLPYENSTFTLEGDHNGQSATESKSTDYIKTRSNFINNRLFNNPLLSTEKTDANSNVFLLSGCDFINYYSVVYSDSYYGTDFLDSSFISTDDINYYDSSGGITTYSVVDSFFDALLSSAIGAVAGYFFDYSDYDQTLLAVISEILNEINGNVNMSYSYTDSNGSLVGGGFSGGATKYTIFSTDNFVDLASGERVTIEWSAPHFTISWFLSSIYTVLDWSYSKLCSVAVWVEGINDHFNTWGSTLENMNENIATLSTGWTTVKNNISTISNNSTYMSTISSRLGTIIDSISDLSYLSSINSNLASAINNLQSLIINIGSYPSYINSTLNSILSSLNSLGSTSYSGETLYEIGSFSFNVGILDNAYYCEVLIQPYNGDMYSISFPLDNEGLYNYIYNNKSNIYDDLNYSLTSNASSIYLTRSTIFQISSSIVNNYIYNYYFNCLSSSLTSLVTSTSVLGSISSSLNSIESNVSAYISGLSYLRLIYSSLNGLDFSGSTVNIDLSATNSILEDIREQLGGFDDDNTIHSVLDDIEINLKYQGKNIGEWLSEVKTAIESLELSSTTEEGTNGWDAICSAISGVCDVLASYFNNDSGTNIFDVIRSALELLQSFLSGDSEPIFVEAGIDWSPLINAIPDYSDDFANLSALLESLNNKDFVFDTSVDLTPILDLLNDALYYLHYTGSDSELRSVGYFLSAILQSLQDGISSILDAIGNIQVNFELPSDDTNDWLDALMSFLGSVLGNLLSDLFGSSDDLSNLGNDLVNMANNLANTFPFSLIFFVITFLELCSVGYSYDDLVFSMPFNIPFLSSDNSDNYLTMDFNTFIDYADFVSPFVIGLVSVFCVLFLRRRLVDAYASVSGGDD